MRFKIEVLYANGTLLMKYLPNIPILASNFAKVEIIISLIICVTFYYHDQKVTERKNLN